MDGVREGFIEQNIITRQQHEKYMKENTDFFWICIVEDNPAGYIGIINDDIRIATHPDYQGIGAASFMINQVMEINPNAQAKVKIKNEKSLKLFQKNGFKKKYYLLEKR